MRIVKRIVLAAAAVALAAAGFAGVAMHVHGHHPRPVAMYHHGRK